MPPGVPNISALSQHQINMFFHNNPSVTQEQCDAMAQEITGHEVTPTASQGGSSYSVEGGEMVVQFRYPDAALDMDLIRSIEVAYEGFAPRHEYRGQLVGGLHVYVMNNLGGCCMYLARNELYANDYQLLRIAIDDYARFFASAYHNTPSAMVRPDRKQLLEKYTSQFQQLREGLPERFHTKLDELIPQVPDLIADEWPLVPNHGDLLENNIHIDTATGKILGICDWIEAEISPFGMSLGGLETMLGWFSVGGDGWTYHPNQQELRNQFYATFYHQIGSASDEQKRRIEAARLIGLFLSHGLLDGEIREEGSLELGLLNAFVLR